jgi:hypothetical protein
LEWCGQAELLHHLPSPFAEPVQRYIDSVDDGVDAQTAHQLEDLDETSIMNVSRAVGPRVQDRLPRFSQTAEEHRRGRPPRSAVSQYVEYKLGRRVGDQRGRWEDHRRHGRQDGVPLRALPHLNRGRPARNLPTTAVRMFKHARTKGDRCRIQKTSRTSSVPVPLGCTGSAHCSPAATWPGPRTWSPRRWPACTWPGRGSGPATRSGTPGAPWSTSTTTGGAGSGGAARR